MEQQHIDTCEEALDWVRQHQEEVWVAWFANKETPSEHRDRIDAARKAVTALRAQAQPPQQPLDFPDSVGWWAFRGIYRWRKELECAYHVTGYKDNHEVEKDDCCAAIEIDNKPGWYPARYATGNRQWEGKWYRLTMPWDAQPPAPQPVPDEVREAIDFALEFAEIGIGHDQYDPRLQTVRDWLAQQPAAQ